MGYLAYRLIRSCCGPSVAWRSVRVNWGVVSAGVLVGV